MELMMRYSKILVSDVNDKNDGRVSHKRLAAALEMPVDNELLRLIERNRNEFERYGDIVLSAVKSSPKGGRPGKIAWLNEGQAILASVRSEAPRSPEVRHQVITAFMEYRHAKITKPIQVREHDRRTSTKIDDALKLKRNVDRLEKVADKIVQPRPNFCAMVIDGESVFVDVNDYDLRGERAAVITWDGKVAIMETDSHLEGHKFAGVRSAHGPKTPGPRNSTFRNGVIVIGKVVGSGPAVGSKPTAAIADAGKHIEHEPIKAPYKKQVLELIQQGWGNAEIARQLGCCIETVSRRRRQLPKVSRSRLLDAY